MQAVVKCNILLRNIGYIQTFRKIQSGLGVMYKEDGMRLALNWLKLCSLLQQRI
jgi:hypothetical protein